MFHPCKLIGLEWFRKTFQGWPTYAFLAFALVNSKVLHNWVGLYGETQEIRMYSVLHLPCVCDAFHFIWSVCFLGSPCHLGHDLTASSIIRPVIITVYIYPRVHRFALSSCFLCMVYIWEISVTEDSLVSISVVSLPVLIILGCTHPLCIQDSPQNKCLSVIRAFIRSQSMQWVC